MSQEHNESSSKCRICPGNISPVYTQPFSLIKGFELRSRRTNLGSNISSSINSNDHEK